MSSSRLAAMMAQAQMEATGSLPIPTTKEVLKDEEAGGGEKTMNHLLASSFCAPTSKPVSPALSAPSLRKQRFSNALYLIFFLAGTLRKQLIELVANLQPIIMQKDRVMVGKSLGFGQPLVPASLLLSLGIPETEFSPIGYSIDETGAIDEDLVALNKLSLTSVPSDYESAFALARSINEGAITQGACESDDLSGGLAGDTALTQYKCTPLHSTTQRSMLGWIEKLEHACNAAAKFDTATLFHKCMLFSSTNPGSNYILMGEASHTMGLSCEYTSTILLPWVDADASTVSGLSDPFKYMTDHRLVCTGPWEYSLFGGFVRQERKLVDQEWTALSHQLDFVDRCDDNEDTSYSELMKWTGGVQVGALEIVQWCADCGWDSTRESCPNHVSAHRCWGEVLSLMDAETATTWERVGRNLPQRIIRAAMDGELRDVTTFSEFWLEFEELLLSKGITDSTSREVFRSTFGWGFKVIRGVVDYSRWVSTEAALHNAGMLDPGTQHVVEMRCTSSDDGTVIEKLDAPGNFRVQGLEVLIPWWSKCINIAMMIGILSLSSISMTMPDSRNVHVLLGITWMVVLVVVWEFELAVSSTVLKACEMRVTVTLGGAMGWFTVLWESVIGRLSVAAIAVSLAQALCWLHNPYIMCTGLIPGGASQLLLYCGAIYAVYISIFCATWWNACSADHNVHQFDRFLPMVLGIGTAIVVTKSMTKTAANNCVCAWEHRESGKELKHDKWDDYIWKKIWLFRVLLANTECDPNPKVDGEEEEQREEVCRVCFKKPRITTDGSHLHDYGLEILGKRIVDGRIILTTKGMVQNDLFDKDRDKRAIFKRTIQRNKQMEEVKAFRHVIMFIQGILVSKGLGDGADLATMQKMSEKPEGEDVKVEEPPKPSAFGALAAGLGGKRSAKVAWSTGEAGGNASVVG